MKLDRQTIVLGAKIVDKRAAIEAVGKILIENGFIQPGYVSSMQKREEVANTFLGNGIAIPHGLPEDRELINRTGIAVLQIPAGVTWNPGETASLVIGIAAKSDEHIGILTNLTRILDDPQTTARLSRTTETTSIIEVLSGQAASDQPTVPEINLEGFSSVVVQISGEHGLHARPATAFIETAKQFAADIIVVHGDRSGNGKSLADLLKLGVSSGHSVQIHARGEDAAAALAALQEAVAAGLGEEQEPSAPDTAVNHGWQPQNVAATVPGIKASPGLAIGPVRQYVHERIVVAEDSKDPEAEKKRLRQAVAAAKENLQQLYDEVRAKTGAAKAAIFKAHLAFLDDPELQLEVRDRIDAGRSAGSAWQQAIDERIRELEQHEDPVLAGRAMDLQDVGRRVLKHIAGVIQEQPFIPTEPVILVAEDLTPSDTAALDPALILGLCTAGGGPTSHSAIIARSLGIPAMVSAGPAVLKISDQTPAILDGDTGTLYLEPSEEDCKAAAVARQELESLRDKEFRSRFEPALTLDGQRIEVVANIGTAAEAEQAVKAGGEGVGLLRTEFLFLGRDTPPDEEEQFKNYTAMLASLNGLPMIVRTLDIGGDKEVPYLDLPAEDNPFLGERGIRLCLKRPELFMAQLRAIYRASLHGPLKIMLPMVSTLEELAAAKQLAEQARLAVGAEPVEIGIMVEVPSVAVMADAFAAQVDFFSVGTNDLTQYVLAMDRLHPTLAAKADSLHPAVLRMIDMVVKAADQAGIWVGVCGGLAGEPLGAVILAGLGVRELSMVIPSIAAIKARLRNITLEEARTLARQALACPDLEQVRKLQLPTGEQR